MTSQELILEKLREGIRVSAMAFADGSLTRLEIDGWYYRVNANSARALLRAGKIIIDPRSDTERPGTVYFLLAEENKT